MYFIPDYMQWYVDIIKRRGPIVWYIVTSGILGISILTWYYSMYLPGKKQMSILHAQMRSVHQEYIAGIKQGTRCNVHEDIEAIKYALNMYKSMQPDTQLPQLSTTIFSAIEASRLHLISYEVLGIKHMQWYQRADVSITVRGTISAFMQVLSQLALERLCIYCQHCVVNKEESTYTVQAIFRSCILL